MSQTRSRFMPPPSSICHRSTFYPFSSSASNPSHPQDPAPRSSVSNLYAYFFLFTSIVICLCMFTFILYFTLSRHNSMAPGGNAHPFDNHAWTQNGRESDEYSCMDWQWTVHKERHSNVNHCSSNSTLRENLFLYLTASKWQYRSIWSIDHFLFSEEIYFCTSLLCSVHSASSLCLSSFYFYTTTSRFHFNIRNGNSNKYS